MIDNEVSFLKWWEGYRFLDENSAWKVFRAMIDLETQVKKGCADRAMERGKALGLSGVEIGAIVAAVGGESGAMLDAKQEGPHVRVGREWMTEAEYRRRYVDNKDAKPEPPCKDTLRCPQALDVFCEECPK